MYEMTRQWLPGARREQRWRGKHSKIRLWLWLYNSVQLLKIYRAALYNGCWEFLFERKNERKKENKTRSPRIEAEMVVALRKAAMA